MLQTHTPGGEPTQSCRKKGHIPRAGLALVGHPAPFPPCWETAEGTPKASWGAEPTPKLGCRVSHGTTPVPRPPGHTDPVRHGPQQAVQVADQGFSLGAGLLHGQAGESPAAVIEGEVTALVGRGTRRGSQRGSGCEVAPCCRGPRSALTMCRMRIRASRRTSEVTTWEERAGDSHRGRGSRSPGPTTAPPGPGTGHSPCSPPGR